MNSVEIDRYLPSAYCALEKFDIAKNGNISNTFRSYISSFGASLTMGNLRAAVAFHSQQNNAKLQRDNLMKALYYIIAQPSSDEKITNTSLLRYIADHPEKDEDVIKEHIYNASIALKLAINMFVIVEE